jgi:hypothetical protein
MSQKNNVKSNGNRHNNLLANLLFKDLIFGSYGSSLPTVLGLGLGMARRDF